ncbi:alpha/beta hydrolase family protein [Pseudonocardia acidicola]|uniref:Alpha/beta hydrolase n=1 Tax=Pseudonocardia acidicola TaxID=2724939 RepID=A0ABX1SBA6_9PSEU|nr:alpha/beta fold hydrolase [Pseudonocardia acidicola]NMH98846.1 alpha/beta hydrolase [Pseudonocardia acidicola]
MHETSLRFDSAGHTLAGTLALPEGDGPFPAVLLVSGSGPLDRNSDHRTMRFEVSRQLAHALAAAGLASLRYDKRGVGESPGDWREAGLFDNVDDAGAALAALAARPEVDAGRVLAAGHSEGALLVTAMAGRGAPVAGLVLLSGSATPGEQLLLWQADRIGATLPGPVRGLLRLLHIDVRAKVAKNHAKIKATTTDVARLGLARLNARWLREFLAYDPRTDLARVRVPVLALTGSNDLQVDPADLDEIARQVPGPVQIHLARGVSHTLRVQPGAPSLRKYKAELRDPIAPQVVRAVVDWCRARTAVTPARKDQG